MSRHRPRRSGLILGLFLVSAALGSCATNNLLRWSRGEPSVFEAPPDNKANVAIRAGGTILVLPAFFVWDVATAPFQWIWGVHPYGPDLDPADQQK